MSETQGPRWIQVIGAFSTALKLDAEAVTNDLVAQVGFPTDEMLEAVGDDTIVTDVYLKEKFFKEGTAPGAYAFAVKKLRAACKAPAETVLSGGAVKVAADAATTEVPEGAQPSTAQVQSFAGTLGMDPMTLMMFMNGSGGDMDISGMVPVATVVRGYNPKLRNMFLMFMGKMEERLGVPIVVIDGDGSINRPLTIEYIEGLEEGREPAENNIYFGNDGTPHEVIRVGVDTQSIYDADPLEPTKALAKSGMGVGRVNWTGVPLEARQVAFYAVTRTHEIDPKNDAHLSWLRDHMKKGVNRLAFHGQAPRAIGEYNEAARTGSLPTLRVMLSRGPRRQELMPRRRRANPTMGNGDPSLGGPTPIGGRWSDNG